MKNFTLIDKIAIAGIFLLFLILHLPIFESEMRQYLIIGNTAILLLCAFPKILNLTVLSRAYSLLFILGLWCIYIYLHSQSHSPKTEYADNKFPYFIIISFLGIFLVPFVVEQYNLWSNFIILLVLFSCIMAAVSFFPSADSSNARYSVLDLSPTMLARIVVIPILAFISYSGRSLGYKNLTGVYIRYICRSVCKHWQPLAIGRCCNCLLLWTDIESRFKEVRQSYSYSRNYVSCVYSLSGYRKSGGHGKIQLGCIYCRSAIWRRRPVVCLATCY